MANHTITVKVEQGGTNNQNIIANQIKGSGIISSKKQFDKKTSLKFGIRKAIRGNPIGAGVITTIAGYHAVMNTVQKGTNIYSNFMEAKTGNTMSYHNLRAGVNILSNPVGYAKKAIWDYGIIQPMKISRQNEALDYQRQLTGNLIHSSSYQKGQF